MFVTLCGVIGKRKSSVACLRDLSFRRQEAVEPDEVETEVLVTFLVEVGVSPNGKICHTSSSCDALRLTTPILKGICSYCKTRASAPTAGSAEM